MSTQALTVTLFVVLGLSLVLVEVYARATGAVSTLDLALRGLLRRRIPQVFVLLAWWWIGWHFFVG